MKRRPVLLVLASILFLFFPAEWWADIHHRRYTIVQGMQMDYVDFLLSVILPLVLMAGLWKVTRFGWYSLICFAVVWGTRDLYLLARAEGSPLWVVGGHVLVFALSLFYFIHPRVRTLYFDPKQQWWKTKPRYATHVPALCFDGSNWHYPILANISAGGCFLESPHHVQTDTQVTVAVPLPEPYGVAVLRVKGEVRWVSSEEGKNGYGIQFTEIDRKNRKALLRWVQANA